MESLKNTSLLFKHRCWEEKPEVGVIEHASGLVTNCVWIINKFIIKNEMRINKRR